MTARVIPVNEHDLGAPFHEAVSEFTYHGMRYANHCTYFAGRVSSHVSIVFDHMAEDERQYAREARWHAPEGVVHLPLSNEGLPRIAELAVASLRR